MGLEKQLKGCGKFITYICAVEVRLNSFFLSVYSCSRTTEEAATYVYAYNMHLLPPVVYKASLDTLQ